LKTLQLFPKKEKPVRDRFKWKPPVEGPLKVNTDGAFNVDHGNEGTGAVIRNWKDEMLQAQAKWYDHIEDALWAEALAMQDGIVLAKANGVPKIIVESDNTSVVHMMSSSEGARSSFVSFWHDVHELSRSFSSISFNFVRQEANHVAYCCAKYADPVFFLVSGKVFKSVSRVESTRYRLGD
jgi:ribonuclease HI